MSANDTAPAGSASARGADVSGAVTARLIEGEVAEDAAVGVIVPATTRPTRKATVAERHTLTARNRRVIVFYYCIEVRLKPGRGPPKGGHYVRRRHQSRLRPG